MELELLAEGYALRAAVHATRARMVRSKVSLPGIGIVSGQARFRAHCSEHEFPEGDATFCGHQLRGAHEVLINVTDVTVHVTSVTPESKTSSED